jgi:cold shock CspA family protein
MPVPAAGSSGAALQTGMALRWNYERGFGFVKPDQGDEDVFCHASAIVGGNALKEGARCEFKIEYDHRRGKHHAAEVSGEAVKNVTVTVKNGMAILRNGRRWAAWSSSFSNKKVQEHFNELTRGDDATAAELIHFCFAELFHFAWTIRQEAAFEESAMMDLTLEELVKVNEFRLAEKLRLRGRS